MREEKEGQLIEIARQIQKQREKGWDKENKNRKRDDRWLLDLSSFQMGNHFEKDESFAPVHAIHSKSNYFVSIVKLKLQIFETNDKKN